MFLTSLTTFILTTPSPLAYPQFYNCSEYFTNQSSRPVISNEVVVEVEHTQLHYWAKIGVLVMFVMYCGRFIIEETPLVLLKVCMIYYCSKVTYIMYHIHYIFLNVGFDSSEPHKPRLSMVIIDRTGGVQHGNLHNYRGLPQLLLPWDGSTRWPAQGLFISNCVMCIHTLSQFHPIHSALCGKYLLSS